MINEDDSVPMDKQKHLRDKKFVYARLLTYTPCAGSYISLLRTPRILGDIRTVEVHGLRVSVCIKPVALFRWGGHLWTEEPLLDRLEYEIKTSKQPWFSGYTISDYVWDPTRSTILIDDSLNKLQRELDVECIRFTADSFFRTIERTAIIKEDLMAAAWHPRRVERLLETHGWAAYENLLGE